MMGTFIVFLAAVYLLLVFVWILKDPDVEKGWGSKSYHMLLFLFTKADLALAAGMEYAKLRLEGIFRGCRFIPDVQKSEGKRAHPEKFRSRMQKDGQDFFGRERYNRRIPG